MTDATRQPVTLDEESYYRDPAGFYARLRESGPVVQAWTPASHVPGSRPATRMCARL